MNTIRKADLNIIAAEWVGLASRTEPPIGHTKTVLISTDPVALDYHVTKYLLHPNSNIPIDEKQVAVKSFDLKTNSFQTDDNLEIIGETTWGSHLKTLMKYLIFKLNL